MTDFAFLRCSVGPGMFDDEYTVSLTIEGKEVFSTVGKENVSVERHPDGDTPGMGWLRVRVVERMQDMALVDLPQPAFTSVPRLKVPLGELRDSP